MPNLPKPRLRRSARARGAAVAPAPEPDRLRIEEVAHGELRWFNVERMGPRERAWLEERFDFHPLDYEDVGSRNQRAKIDEYDGYLFAILFFPRFDKELGRLNAAELDLFVGPDFLVTMPNAGIKSLEFLFERCRGDAELRARLFSQGSGYLLYKVVDDCVDASFPMLRKIGNKLERLEEAIFEGRSDEVVRDISNAKQEIINFRKIVRPQRVVFSDLERTKNRFLSGDLEIYFDDINDASERIWQLLEGYKETVEALENTNESVLSHRLNDVLRVLTVLTVIFLPPTLISGIFGMNNHVPGEGSDTAFWIVIGVIVFLLLGMLVFFKRRRWL